MAVNPSIEVELFISHASEDKEALVRPLADWLRRWGVKVWYDEFSLKPGDSITRSLDKGLSIAQYGLVVISPDFIRKPWPEYELRGLTTVEIQRRDKVIIPVWHRVTMQDVLAFSPTLADKMAVVTDGKDPQQVAEAVIATIRPDLADRLSLFRALTRVPPDTAVQSVPLDQLAQLPAPRRFTTEGPTLIRAMLVVETLQEPQGFVGSIEGFLTSLYQDLHPEVELRLWELFALVFVQVDRAHGLTEEQRTAVVRLLLAATTGSSDDVQRAIEFIPEPIAISTLTQLDKLTPLSRLDSIPCERNESGEVSIVVPAADSESTVDGKSDEA